MKVKCTIDSNNNYSAIKMYIIYLRKDYYFLNQVKCNIYDIK